MSGPGPLLELSKPRLTLLVLATVALSFFMAPGDPAAPFPSGLLAHALLGSALIGAGINALNQYLESAIDARMKRTVGRPIPSGRIRPEIALIFGSVLAVLGDSHLFWYTNRLTGFIGMATIVSYVFVYTPLKLKTRLNTLAGAIPGALPCLIGWTARQGGLDAGAWSLFWILFFWQLPHFLAIAWVYRHDYGASGLRMVASNDPDGQSTGLKTLVSSALLFVVTLAPVALGLVGNVYLAVAIATGLITIGAALHLYAQRMAAARAFVSWSIGYLVILILAMMADKTL